MNVISDQPRNTRPSINFLFILLELHTLTKILINKIFQQKYYYET